MYRDLTHIRKLSLTWHQKTKHRRSQDFVWGCTFFLKKADDLFCSSPSKDGRRSKTTKSTTPTSKSTENVLKLILALPGVHLLC